MYISAACAAAIVHRNHFCFYQQNKFSESEVKFRQASSHCKRVLEAAKLVYANKTKEFHHFPETWLSGLCFSTKVNLLYLLYTLKVLSSASDKLKLFTKNRSKNSNLDDSGISLPIFPSKTNLNLHTVHGIIPHKAMEELYGTSRNFCGHVVIF